MFVLTGLNTYWYFKPYDIIKFFAEKNEILNENHTIKAGDTIKFRAHYDMLLGNIPVEFIYYLEPTDPTAACEFKILGQGKGETKAGLVDRINSTLVVPLDFKPCEYHVRITSIYQPNPQKKITKDRYTEDFKVIK